MDNKFHRRSVRLKHWDYSMAWFYFVTICTYQKKYLLDEIKNGKMMVNTLGNIVRTTLTLLPNRFSISLDEWVIMPNHIHAIIVINDNVNYVGARLSIAQEYSSNGERATARVAPTLGSVIGAFKSITSVVWLKYIKVNNLQISGEIWQRNYYEHVIRNEKEYEKIRRYIWDNPLRWEYDRGVDDELRM